MHLVTHFGASFCSSAHSGEVGKKVHNVRDCKPRWDPGGRAADHNPQTQPRPHVWGLGRGESLRLSGHPSDRPRHRTGPGAGNCVRAQDCSCGSVSKSFLIYSSPSLCLPKTPPSISPFPHLINTKWPFLAITWIMNVCPVTQWQHQIQWVYTLPLEEKQKTQNNCTLQASKL